MLRKVHAIGEQMGGGNICPLIPAYFYLQNHWHSFWRGGGRTKVSVLSNLSVYVVWHSCHLNVQSLICMKTKKILTLQNTGLWHRPPKVAAVWFVVHKVAFGQVLFEALRCSLIQYNFTSVPYSFIYRTMDSGPIRGCSTGDKVWRSH